MQNSFILSYFIYEKIKNDLFNVHIKDFLYFKIISVFHLNSKVKSELEYLDYLTTFEPLLILCLIINVNMQ